MQLRKGKTGAISQKRGEGTEGKIAKTQEWGAAKLEVEAMLLQQRQNKQAQNTANKALGKKKFEQAKRDGKVGIAVIQGREYMVPQMGGIERAEEFGLTIDDHLDPQKRVFNAKAEQDKRQRSMKVRSAVKEGKLKEVAGYQQSRNQRNIAALAVVAAQKNRGDVSAQARASQLQQKQISSQKLRADANKQLQARNMRTQGAVAAGQAESQQIQRGQSKKFQESLKQSRSGTYTVPNRTALVKNPFTGFKQKGYSVPQLGGADFGNTCPLHDCGYLNNVQILGEDEVW